jgi:RND superfamily putative drug exporter
MRAAAAKKGTFLMRNTNDNRANRSDQATGAPLLRRLGSFVVRRRWWVIAASLVMLLVSASIGTSVIGALSLARFEVAGSESDRAGAILAEQFGVGAPNLVLLVTAKRGTVDDPALVAAGSALTRELAAQDGVAEATSYWSRPFAPALRSQDGTQALVMAHLPGDATEARERLAILSPQLTREDAFIRVQAGGQEEIFRQVGAQSERDFIRSDAIAIPLILVLLMLVFRNVRAAALTLLTSVFAILGTLLVLRALITVTDVSTFALNLTMVLGLGIGVDYCLFIVSRFREERDAGVETATAVVRTVETAGRTILFSAMTVAVSLAALLVLPFFFLRSFAYAGIAVIAIGAASAVITLPAALAILGDRLAPWAWWPRRAPSAQGGFWHRIALLVMRRPAIISVAVVVLLLILGSPILRIRFGSPDDRILPPTASSRQVQEQIRAHFATEEADALQIVALDRTDPATQQAAIEHYARDLSQYPGVFQVDALTGSYARGMRVAPPHDWHRRFAAAGGTWMSVVPTKEQLDSDPFGLVDAVRALPAPFPVAVGGSPAIITDFQSELLADMPLVAGIVVVLTFLFLFLMTGSVLLPAKAIVLNILSLSATFGALVWVFQEGNLAGLLAFTPTGSMELSIPILLFCLAFGLSMDYEVFVLSRIKEAYDRSGDNAHAVAVGLERSGPLITAAAVLLAVAFMAFATSDIVLLKMLGVGMTLPVLVDATIIRALLVPAFMELMGRANWWAPPALQRLQQRVGLSEAESRN